MLNLLRSFTKQSDWRPYVIGVVVVLTEICLVGADVGSSVGSTLGVDDGAMVGLVEGTSDGLRLGTGVGTSDGVRLGIGVEVGLSVV